MTGDDTVTPSAAFSLRRQTLGLLVWLGVVGAALAVGAAASVQAATFYAGLQQPAWAPPGWVFAPVWTTLYGLMGVAAWRVWRRGGWHTQRGPLALFAVQLAANMLWSWLFFAWRQGGWAFVDVLVLWGLLGATVIAFWRVDRLAGALLIPYWAWVSFAAALNLAVWQLNPGVL